jgi:membrane-bound lytic murein transglycosylase B
MKKADFAFTELVAVLSMYRENLDRLYYLRGSYAGAMGIPQFLPSSYLSWAVDGNGDERVDLDNLSDAMASVGNYLRSHGWTPEASLREKWRAVWEYNHSDNYVRTMFEIAFRLSTPRKRKRRRVAMVMESTAVESAAVESTIVESTLVPVSTTNSITGFPPDP